MGTKIRSVALLTMVAALLLTGCGGGKKTVASPEKPAASKSTEVNPSPPPAPAGWVNSKDGFFRVKMPWDYLDSYEAVGGSEFPDAQVILSEPSTNAVAGYVSTVVIDKAPVTTDADYVKSNLEHDPTYANVRDFKVEKSPENREATTLFVSWNFSRKDVDMKAWVCFISGHEKSYAIKQEVPAVEGSQIPTVIPELVGSWVWNPASDQTKQKN